MNPAFASFIIRLGLSIAFFYAAVGSLLFPDNWLGFVPVWLIPAGFGKIFLSIFAAVQLSLGLWLLSGRWIKYAARMTAILMFMVVITNPTAMDLIFRDITIAFSAIALPFIHQEKNNNAPI